MVITNRYCFLSQTALFLLTFIGVIESITECLAPRTIINGCAYQCKNPEYAFICEDNGYDAYKCNRTCPGGRCVDSLCQRLECEAGQPEGYEQTYTKLCQGRNMQMGQVESNRGPGGIRFRRSYEGESSYPVYLNTLVPILAGGLVMCIILVLVRLCGRRGQVRTTEAVERADIISQPQIRYPCQLLPLSFSALPNPLNPQYLGQAGQGPNAQLAQVAGTSPNHHSKTPISTRSNQQLIANEERPGTSSPNPKRTADAPKKPSMPPMYATFHVESEYEDLPPAYEDLVFSSPVKEDDKNIRNHHQKDGN